MNTDEAGWNAITERVIGCAYKVAGKMGCGFLEKCYENALAHEMKKSGLAFQQQVRLDVWYDDEVIVGEYVADFIVEGSILVELKAIQALESIHTAQCINYLAATKLPICLLINFGKRVEVKRVVGSTFKNSNRSPS